MIDITNIAFTEEFNGSGATSSPFIMGSVGDKITAVITLTAHWESLVTYVIFTASDKTIKRVDNVSWIDLGFRVGDTFTISGSATNDATGYVIAALTDKILTTVGAINTATNTGVNFYGTTVINAMDFYFNLIENNETLNFVSKVDNQSLQKRSVSKTAWAATETITMAQSTTSLGWNTATGTNTIKKETPTVANTQLFTVTHTFLITPDFLDGQQSLFVSPYINKPSYFKDSNSLKYVCRADARYSGVDPNIAQTTPSTFNFNRGNVGWFNEFLNGGVPIYSILSIAYTDVLTSETLTEIDLNKDTLVTISLYSSSGTFAIPAAGSAMLTLNMIQCPLTESDYVNTSTDFYSNFKYDRKLITCDAASVNGEQYGTSLQSLKGITMVRVDNTHATLTFTVSYSAEIKAYLKLKDATNRNYLIWVTPQKHTATTLALTDRNAVLCDFRNAEWNQNDSSLLTWSDTYFYQYPDTTTNPYTDLKAFIGDIVLIKSRFKVKKSAVVTSYARRGNVRGGGILHPLYQMVINLTGLAQANNEICTPVSSYLNYKLAADDERNSSSFFRNVALDTLTEYGYEYDAGLLIRYEEWRNNPDYDIQFECDHTQKWSIYDIGGFAIEITDTVEVYDPVADYTTTFERISPVRLYDENTLSDGKGGTLTYTLDTQVLDGTYKSVGGFILADDVTHVKLTITGADFTVFPAGYDGYYGYLALDIEGSGGQYFIDKATTEENQQEGSLWLSKATLTVVNATTITITADIDNSMLDGQVDRYLITGRFGFKKS